MKHAMRWLGLVVVLALSAHSHAVETRRFEGRSVGAPVTIAMDELGVPRIEAATHEDASYAIGFLHGHERFFQMDLARRSGAGRLSELAGAMTVGRDRFIRVWDFQRVAREMIERLTEEQRGLMEAYVRGVNDGLGSRTAPPPEYLLLGGVTPEPWTMEDSALVTLVLVNDLSHHGWDERWNEAARRSMPAALFEFLHPRGGRMDASLSGDRAPRAPIPGPEVIDLRTDLSEEEIEEMVSLGAPILGDGPLRGSNNWAIAAGRSKEGRAILASDPHLGLMLPNVWYRAEMHWGEGEEAAMMVGVTLPGLPVVVMGSNGHLAWGFTNVHGDFEDRVIVPDGAERVERREEIVVRGRAEPEIAVFVDTPWGPVTDEYDDPLGRTIAMKWTGQMPEANGFEIFGMPDARTLEEGLDLAASWMSAPQNTVIASSDGRVGWTITGYLPRRIGFDGTLPMEWVEGEVGWEGQLDPAQRPRVIVDADGFVFTANNRVASLEASLPIGRWFPHGARAHRIREVLSRGDRFDERGMLALQLDTRASSMDAWRDLVLRVIPEDEADALLMTARRVASGWSGSADIEDTGHAFVRRIGAAVSKNVMRPYVTIARRADPDVWARMRYRPDVALLLLEEQPEHLLPPGYASWDDLARGAIREVAERMGDGIEVPWGDVHRAKIEHPLASLLGRFLRGLSAPADALHGDWTTVRVSGPAFGASVRFVVSPGHEREGILHMPGGQSGIPSDPRFLKGHEDWVEGRPTGLLSGEAVEFWSLEP